MSVALLAARRRPSLSLEPDPSLPLGLRALAWSEAELARGAAEDPPGSNGGAAIASYFAGARRRGTEALLGVSSGNWCAAGASAATYASLLPGETAPHGWRAAVVELVDDAKAAGAWLPVEDARAGWSPGAGDLVIYDRSDPAIPDSSWWRHVNRIRDWRGDGTFETIGANENDRWSIGEHSLDEPKILGFVMYPGSGARKSIGGSAGEGSSTASKVAKGAVVVLGGGLVLRWLLQR